VPEIEITIRAAGDVDQVLAAGFLLDGPPQPEPTASFLAQPGHHLLLAYEGERPVGFVTGVEMTHPDKGTEMFLYELAVAETHRRQGIGSALVRRLGELARARNCIGMWVATDLPNRPAQATYESTGAVAENPPAVILSWRFD